MKRDLSRVLYNEVHSKADLILASCNYALQV